jgi:hypothetical protein
MAAETPFGRGGKWLRCALHAHTTNSDGELAPEHLVRHYERAGYDVLCITDHWVRTVEESTEHLIVIPGIELNATLDGTGSDAHVLALGVAADPVEPGRAFPNLAETVGWIRESDGLPFLAHPYWSGLRTEEFESCDGLLGLEVFNAGCELEIGRGLSSTHWDEALERGAGLFGLATDDSHLPGFDSGFGSVWVNVEDASAEAVLAALGSGAFYSSTGPRIESVTVTADAVEVVCTPAAAVRLVSSRFFGSTVTAGRMGYSSHGRILEQTPGEEVTAASLARLPPMSYGRIEVVDACGRKAWTNPLWP